MKMIAVKVCFFILLTAYADGTKFPDNFKFGVATSAYQIEGAWNTDGKGPNIWDNFTRREPSPIFNNQNGDVACDSYNKYKEDVSLISDLGLDIYRFSISWARILPTGYATEVNEKGLEYYKNLVKELISHNITPAVSIYHWDLPQQLLEDGMDWTNPKFVDIFVDYARIVIKNLPEVEMWFTINEPKQVCSFGYGRGILAPGIVGGGILDYQCDYVLLKSHAAVYHMYKEEFPHYTAKMTIAPDVEWVEPKNDSYQNLAAVERKLQFESAIFLHPVFVGDWPDLLKTRVAERSLQEGYNQSRLPSFTEEEINYIKGTADFMALNHYVTFLVEDDLEAPINTTSSENDIRLKSVLYPSDLVGSNGNTANPWGLRKMLKWIKQQYGDHEIILTEVGISDDGSSLEDDDRIKFYTGMYCKVLEAIYEEDVNVVGIINWSLLDNFEWTNGYGAHFGHYYINSTDPEKTRVPKKSTKFIKELIKTKNLICNNDN